MRDGVRDGRVLIVGGRDIEISIEEKGVKMLS